MTGRHRKRDWLHGLGAVGVLAVALVVLGASASEQEGGGGPAVVVVDPPPPAVLVAVAGGVAAVSTVHGPRHTDGGRAWGFSHDELGAAVAASNLAPRVAPAAGPEVFETTLAQQCWGDVPTTATLLRATVARPDPDSSAEQRPRALRYRILAGDPGGNVVAVALLANLPSGTESAGPDRLDVTLRWQDGDWRLRVPLPPAHAEANRDGYLLLAGTP